MTVLRFAGFELDQQRAELRGPDGGVIKLRPKTFEMLRLFAANAGRVLRKQELMETVWPNVYVSEDSLFQCIREIRTALGDERRQMVKLASGGGYLFAVEVSIAPDDLAALGDAASPAKPEQVDQASVEVVSAFATSREFSFGLRGRAAVVTVAGLCAVVGLAVAAPVLGPDLIFKRAPPIVAVMPVVDASSGPGGAAMASEVTGRLTEGFAKIDNIRVVAPPSAAARSEQGSAPSAAPDFEVSGELQRGEQSWTLRARLIKTATGEVQSVATASVDADEPDIQLQQLRLAAGVGDLLARRLNELLESNSSGTDGGKVAIEQATASINRTTRERFGMAQTMLQKALAAEPDNVDIAVALASLQLRGIQIRWYSPDDAVAAEAKAASTLERAQRAKPNSIAVHETYCRFLSATNRFVESLVACSRALSFDPWNGLALYLVGLNQIFLGRFDDSLATFRQADHFDTPRVSRWTWLLGAGWANLMMGRGDDAVPWFQRSIAITDASGRSHMLLAAAYQKAGRVNEAKAAMQEGLKLHPGTTMLNVAPPAKNASPVYLEAADRVVHLMVEAGLPER
jgi:DNA-binding winged helix-turn-helix (wHTH) protein/tetratricopeptide (TPR) repeat protein